MALDPTWSWEKSANIVRGLCDLLVHVKRFESDLPPERYDARGSIFSLLYDATKIMCMAIAHFHVDDSGTRWSPDIAQYFFDHPERCDETIQIIESKDFRDQYYEKGFFNEDV